MSDVSGIWVALVTPFHGAAQGHMVDHAALRRLVAQQSGAGVTGLVALGSTGEAAALDEAEQDAVLDTILDAAQGLPVIAGLAGNHAGHVQARLARLNRLPLHGLLCPAPYYVRPSQAGLIAHFTALADASRAPLLLYDIPYRTGVQMSTDTILALAAHPHIIGIKDCGGCADKTQRLIADGRLQVLAGEDTQIFANLCLGGSGAITAAAQVLPQAFMSLYQALNAQQLVQARRVHHALTPLVHALFAEPNPSVIKAALALQGLCLDEVRPPLLPASDAARAGWLQAWASWPPAC